METWTNKSTNNAFTLATNSINWRELYSQTAGVQATAKKVGSPVYLPNSRQQQAYSAAGLPK